MDAINMMEELQQSYDTKDIEGESEHNLNKNKASFEDPSVHQPNRAKLEQSEIEQPGPETSSKLEQQDPGASDGSSLIETRSILDPKTAYAYWVKNGRSRYVYIPGTNGPDIVFTCILPPKEKRSRPTPSDYGWGPLEMRTLTDYNKIGGEPEPFPDWPGDDKPAEDFYTLYPQLKGWNIVDSDDE